MPEVYSARKLANFPLSLEESHRQRRAIDEAMDGEIDFMARTARIVLEGVAHHIVARGVNRTKLFRHGFDKRKYLKRFAEIAAEENVQVHGYCLMKKSRSLVVNSRDAARS